MTFMHLEYLLPLVVIFAFSSYYFIKKQSLFFRWVKDHWFYKQSLSSAIAQFCYLMGFALLLIALLDLRGPEKRIKGNKVEQKTIILLDSSASMLAEDVRPNRFSKALMLIKHYVKKAVGQKVSLVVFSDSQKRIVPFTEDINLINARLGRLEQLNLKRGGTALAQAVQESIQYFISSSDEVLGNILIFTDAEETELGFNINVPANITIGLVGVGTRNGAPIPMRNSQGTSMGNKKHNGKVVITKLDEKYIKSFGEKIKNFKYWIATSYSLPTEEIINFFNRSSEIKQSEQEFRIRPIYSSYLLVPALLLLTIAVLLKNLKSFVPLVALLLCLNPGLASEEEEEKEPVKSEKTLTLEHELAKGELSQEGQFSLSYHLLKDGFPELAKRLFRENISQQLKPDELNAQFDLAVAEISTKEREKGIERYKDLLLALDKAPQSAELEQFKELIKKNVLLALMNSQGGGKGKDENKQDQNKDNKDDQNQSQSQGKGEKKDQDKDQESKGDDKKDNQDKNEPQDGDKKKQDKKNDAEANKKVAKKKIPTILKQLMSKDNNLQKKYIDAETIERKSRNKKDW